MTTFEDIVRAIRRNPAEKVPRLMYADWLDEHRASDSAAVATAEFIRIAAGPVRGPWPMPLAAYAWWRANWRRLIPRVLAMDTKGLHVAADFSLLDAGPTVRASAIDMRLGVVAKYNGPVPPARQKVYSCRFRMWASEGMVHHWEMPSPFGRERVEPALRQDQPHLFVGDVPVETLPLVSEVSDAHEG